MASKAKQSSQPTGGRKPFTPRPQRTPEERLPKLYRALTDQVDDGYFENAKKTCKKILALDSSSTAAFQTLLFILLHTDDYASALTLVADSSPQGSTLEFERAYCLYRLHREREALEILQGFEKRGRKELHLEAQIRYRIGEYERAQALYDELLATTPVDSTEYDDIRTNQAATAAHLAFTTRDYTSYLSSAAVENPSSGLVAYTPAQGEIESYVPSVPIGWSTGAASSDRKVATPVTPSSSTSTAKQQGTQVKIRTKPRHKLPKGAVGGKPFTQDPDRWLPLRQRASYVSPSTSASKKKGGKEATGLGTQGSTTASSGGGAGSGGGGGKGKKGKKK